MPPSNSTILSFHQIVQYNFDGRRVVKSLNSGDYIGDFEFKAYPNPVTDFITLIHNSDGRIKYRMVDISGRMVRKEF